MMCPFTYSSHLFEDVAIVGRASSESCIIYYRVRVRSQICDVLMAPLK